MFSKALQRSLLMCIGLCLVVQPGLMAQSQLSDPPSDRQISGPVLGYVVSNPSGVTPLLGIPGALTWGATIRFPEIAQAVVSMEREYVFALSAKDHRPMIVGNLRGPVAISTMDTLPPIEEFALSSDGAVAALREKTTGRIRVVGGLPDSPATLWAANFGTVPGKLQVAAVADDGQTVLGVVANGQQRFLVLMTRFGGWKYLMALEGPASISYLRGASGAVAADRDANQAYLIRDVQDSGSIVPLAGERDGVSRPIAVAMATNNQHAIVVNSDPRGVTFLSLSEGTAQTVASPCASVGLQQLAGDSVFLLQQAEDSQLCLFDGDSSPPRVLVVPPPADGSDRIGVNQ